jgi:hypothetical protein
LVGIERSGPAQGDYFKKKKFFGFIKKIPIPKSNFLIFAKNIFRFRELGSCRLEFRARDPTIPEFFKNRKPTSAASACDDLIVLANVCW